MDTKIDIKRLKELEKAEAKLRALENGGVDNWEWYDQAMKPYVEEVERKEDIDTAISDICVIICENGYEPSERGAGIAIHEEGLEEAKKYMNNFIDEFMEKYGKNSD